MWFLLGLLLAFPILLYAQIPSGATKYKRDLIRNARLEWGLDAPISTFAAQIHQESTWNPDAKSPVGASGMAQFMPATSEWISGLYSQLATNEPLNPAWAIRALVVYDKHLYDAVPPAATHCDQMAFTLSSYNGGLGWLNRDVALAADRKLMFNKWWENVERVNAGRANWAISENRGYVRRILLDLEKRYNDAGWGMKSC